jgi:aminoglycoside phosphotransferase (APT) family kinase protein
VHQLSELRGSRTLDNAWLKERLADHLWRDDERPGHVVGVRMVHRRESPKGGIRSLYRVTLRGCDNRLLEQSYTGSELPASALRHEYDAWLSKATIVPALGRAVILIPEANLVLLAFPNNRQMRVLTNEDLTAWLTGRATVLASRGRRGSRWHLRKAEMQLMQYHPGQRLTVRCRGLFEAEDGTEQHFAYIAKQFRKQKRARSVFRNLVSLGKHFDGSSSVRLPRALAFDDKTGLVMMEELPGTELERALPEVDLDRVLPSVGAMLASFHQAPRRVRKTISRRSELEKVRGAAKTIGSVVSSVLPRLDACVSGCREARWADDAFTVMLHGAYRPKHVLIDGARLGLIDVDGIRMGHPAYDLAEFLASLYFLEAHERISPAVRQAAAQRFLAGYAAQALRRPTPNGVLWFLGTLLLHKHARKQAVWLDEDREKKVCHFLTLAETALRGCTELCDGRLEAISTVMP